MSTPASSSIARTNRLPSGTSKPPTPSTSSLGTRDSFHQLQPTTVLREHGFEAKTIVEFVVTDRHGEGCPRRRPPRWRAPAACPPQRRKCRRLLLRSWARVIPLLAAGDVPPAFGLVRRRIVAQRRTRHAAWADHPFLTADC